MMTKTFKSGDKVSWETSQGTTQGEVVKKQTKPITIKGHKVKASPDNPEYVVKSRKSGDKAAHKPEALKKLS